MKLCKNCRFLGRTTMVNTCYIRIQKEGRPPRPTTVEAVLPTIPICKHSACFIDLLWVDPVRGPQHKMERTQGQAQLNRNGDCIFYKRKWYKFWVKPIAHNE